ncbi:MAG: LCP family protein [Parcubacteria group bacterium]|nr:LCP family protein [Parcubacteria group bacterium]
MNMDKRNRIDFLGAPELIREFSTPAARKKFFRWTRAAPLSLTLALLLGLAYTTRAVISSNELAQQLGSASVFEQLKHLATAGDRPLDGESERRINVLLLGIGGEAHEGGQLSDTIIVASIDPQKPALGLLSLPRDLVVAIPGVGWQKINAAHAYGAAAQPDTAGAGAALAKKTVTNTSGQEIHYYIKLDFEGFTKVVDALGGIRVDVPVSFTDYEYPDENFGYAPVHFDAGWQNLTGEQALQYVRSRHGTEGQGTDFARAARQQQILEALLARVSALSTLLNPNKLLALSDIIGTHIETDMELWQLLRLYDIGKNISPGAVTQVVLSNEAGGLLSADTNEEGTYLLRPRLGAADFSEIQAAAQNILAGGARGFAREIRDAGLRIAIQNGTAREGLAAAASQKLQLLPYRVTQVSNAEKQNYERTVIYKLSSQANEEDISLIRQALNANVAPVVPDFLREVDADVLIIVGGDSPA